MNGTIGERAQACEAMAEKLRTMFPKVQVVLWDERLSTVAAERCWLMRICAVKSVRRLLI